MKEHLEHLLADAVLVLKQSSIIPADYSLTITVSRSRHFAQGDFTTNLAIVLAKPAGLKPLALASILLEALSASAQLEKIELAGRGFINFYMLPARLHAVVPRILREGNLYGQSEVGRGRRIQLELVSTHSLGPLPIECGRAVAMGAVIGNLLLALGYGVQREFSSRDILCRDTSQQCDTLTSSSGQATRGGLQLHDDMTEFGVHYDVWLGERSLEKEIQSVIDKLKLSGCLYKKEKAWWLRSSKFGDEKDRMLVRKNGARTCYAIDIAHLMNKLAQDYDQVLYVLCADQHAYAKSLVAACNALNVKRGKFEFLLIQITHLSGGPSQLRTVRQLCEETGRDAARYCYVTRRYQRPLEFDLELAKSELCDNPLCYVQYAHARICSVMRLARDKGYTTEADLRTNLEVNLEANLDTHNLALLVATHERKMLTLLDAFPEIITRAALRHEPHQVTRYLQELANGLNKYHEAHKWLVEDKALRQARFCLILAARQVLVNGLSLLDVSAPEVL